MGDWEQTPQLVVHPHFLCVPLSNRELSTVTYYLFRYTILSLFSFRALSSKNFHTLRKNEIK